VFLFWLASFRVLYKADKLIKLQTYRNGTIKLNKYEFLHYTRWVLSTPDPKALRDPESKQEWNKICFLFRPIKSVLFWKPRTKKKKIYLHSKSDKHNFGRLTKCDALTISVWRNDKVKAWIIESFFSFRRNFLKFLWMNHLLQNFRFNDTIRKDF
jgi:hypothetical protein